MIRVLILSFMFCGTALSFAQEDKPNESSGFEGNEAGDRRELVPGIFFRWCPAGKFKMGEGDSAVDAELTRGFWLGETEVTQGQWQKIMGTTPWKGPGRFHVKEGDDYAASYISHDDAMACLKKLTNQETLPKGWKYSLPTEAQSEYACRAGTTTKYPFGDSASSLVDYGWFGENAKKKSENYAHVVGSKTANAWGLRDMHGNVWEWCSDWYGKTLKGGKDPVGPSSGSDLVVIRGGSWDSFAADCRSASRSWYSPEDRENYLGFRIAIVQE
jgi:formylglycine-generating enzyme required for sulfatase activity